MPGKSGEKAATQELILWRATRAPIGQVKAENCSRHWLQAGLRAREWSWGPGRIAFPRRNAVA